jgi:hypothetical protein
MLTRKRKEYVENHRCYQKEHALLKVEWLVEPVREANMIFKWILLHKSLPLIKRWLSGIVSGLVSVISNDVGRAVGRASRPSAHLW